MMMRRGFPLLVVFAVAVFLLASCGGGDSTTTLPGTGVINTGGNQVPELIIDGPTQYTGKANEEIPELTDPGLDPIPGGTEPPWDFGNVFSIPIDTNGTGRVDVDSFSPGQKVALVVLNLNPAYLDLQYRADSGFPSFPDSSYSFNADLVNRGVSSVNDLDRIREQTLADLGSPEDYEGMVNTSDVPLDPKAIYEREAEAAGITPYSVDEPVKHASGIQKGEIRTFVTVEPTIAPPPIPPGENDPERDTSDLRYPYEYRSSQDGRLVAIGAHCLVFLSTEINNGHPDTIQFTEPRLTRLAREFDQVIYPIETAAFGPVQHYNELNVLYDLDRGIILTGDDFSGNGQPLVNLPGSVDLTIRNEEKIIIFLYNTNGAGGGFYTWGISGEARELLIEEGRQDELDRFDSVGSTLYIDSANFPNNDDAWSSAYSVIAHEFQHKLHADNDLPQHQRDPNAQGYGWFNEGLSQMAIHLCGYTVNSGKIIDWAIDGQLTDYLTETNRVPVPADRGSTMELLYPVTAHYGAGFLFFLYLYEHYPAGIGRRIYERANQGETNHIRLIEYATGEDFSQTYAKWALANFIDGIYAANDAELFDPRFHYNTIDLRGTINLTNGTVLLPGVQTTVYPDDGSFPVVDIDRLTYPWCMDYLVVSNGDGRNLSVTMYTDPYFRMFMLPVNFNIEKNAVEIVPNVTINY